MPLLARAALVLFLAFTATVQSARACDDCGSSADAPASVAVDGAPSDAVDQGSHEGEDCSDCDGCGSGCAACPCCGAFSVYVRRVAVSPPDPAFGTMSSPGATSAAWRELAGVFQPPRA